MNVYIIVCVTFCTILLQAHLELQESLAASQKESLEGLQESTSKMMSQQAEAARHTAEAARHIKEVNNICLPLCLGNNSCLRFKSKADC